MESNSRIADYSEVYQRLPFKTNFAYSIGHVLNDVCASMWFTYLLVFFNYVLGFDNWQAGALLLVGQIADAVATPFVGYYSDQGEQWWFCRYGKRKLWHLVGTVLVILSFPFIFSPCIECENSSKTAQMVYFSMFIIVFQFGWAAVQISHLSLIPELTPNEHDRTRLTAGRNVFTVVANVMVYIMTWVVLRVGGGGEEKVGPDDSDKFQIIVWAVMSFGLICTILFHILIKETNDSTGHDVSGTKMRSSVKSLLTDWRVYHVALIYMCSRLFVNLVQVFMSLYLHESLDMVASSLALVPLAMFIASFVTSFVAEPINKCANKTTTYMIGATFGLAACLWIRWGEGEFFTSYLIYAVAALLGASGAIITVSSLDIISELIGENTDSGAFVFGIMSFVDKLSNGLAVQIIEILHGSDDDSHQNWFYRDVLTDVCGGAIILGAIAVLFRSKKQHSVPPVTTKSTTDLIEEATSSQEIGAIN